MPEIYENFRTHNPKLDQSQSMHALSVITIFPLHKVIAGISANKEHYKLFMATKSKEYPITIHTHWLIWNP